MKERKREEMSTEITLIDKTNNPNNNNINILAKGKQEGQKILQENDFFYELNEIMHDVKFRPFYDKYFKDTSDTKTALLYLKLYETLEKEYKERNNKDIDEELLVYMMKELMSNEITRKNIMNSFNNYFNPSNITKKLYLLDVLEENGDERCESKFSDYTLERKRRSMPTKLDKISN